MVNISVLFEKSLKDIEAKMKELFINKIKIKENVKSIQHYENKNFYLDNVIKDKKTELGILKQLLILKEKKKSNFDYIISKYFSHIIMLNNKNKEIKPNVINEKKVNSLLKAFNNEFNYYLNLDKKNSKKKLHRYNSDLFNKELLKKNNEDFNNNDYNNHNYKPLINNNKIKNISKKANNNFNNINYEGNKNLTKSRENLEYYFLNNKNKKNKTENYFSFIKLIFLKINIYRNNINKIFLSKIIYISKFIKFKEFLSFWNIRKAIISRIKIIMTKSSQIYNTDTNEDIINDDDFINNLNFNYNNKIENKNKIQAFKSGLEEMKNINSNVKEIIIKINDFIEKCDELK